MQNKILITGGAGYIGTHLIKNLLKSKYQVVAFDNLSTGFLEPISLLTKEFGNLEFIRGDLSDQKKLEEIFDKNQIEAVIHLAAKIDVAESVINSKLYHQENYINSVNLVESMIKKNINKIVFSSTAAVYGQPLYTPIDEKHPTNPDNPYGQSKLDFERYLKQVSNLKYIILRYFNVGGSDPEGILGKSHLKNNDLIESIMKVALGQKDQLEIFGSDYETPDGTTIRDFIHVNDIAEAHILAMENIEKFSGEIFNLGSEKGFSIKEIINQANLVFKKKIPVKAAKPRKGDIVTSIASSKKAKDLLGWQPKYSDLETIIRSDWNWRKVHPWGYKNVGT